MQVSRKSLSSADTAKKMPFPFLYNYQQVAENKEERVTGRSVRWRYSSVRKRTAGTSEVCFCLCLPAIYVFWGGEISANVGLQEPAGAFSAGCRCGVRCGVALEAGVVRWQPLSRRSLYREPIERTPSPHLLAVVFLNESSLNYERCLARVSSITRCTLKPAPK